MKNEQVRELIAKVAESRLGWSRQQLNYACEETCAEGVTDVLNTVSQTYNVEGLKVGSVSCNTMYANMTQSPYWYEPSDWMCRGDVIFFDWDLICEEKPLDHVGIVLGVEGDTVKYANINGSSHNNWTSQTMKKESCNIAYWLRYLNPTPKAELDQEQSKDDILQIIEKLQQLRDDITACIDMYIRSLKNTK